MAVPGELNGRREVVESIDGLSATRVFLTSWATRYTSPVLPVLNQSHPDFSNLRVTSRRSVEYGGEGSAPRIAGGKTAEVTVAYSSRPTGDVAITATTISFADTDPDTILDSGNGFIIAGFVIDQTITVSGSTSNDAIYTVRAVTAGTLTLDPADSLTTEAAGDTVTIVQDNVEIEDNIEMSAQAITLDVDGSRTFVTGGQQLKDPIVQLNPQTVRSKTKIVDTLPEDQIDALQGKLNIANFLGRGAGLWLFLGASATSERDSSGDKKWTIVYRFQFNSLGWNMAHNKDNVGAGIQDTTLAFVNSGPDTITDSGSGLGFFIVGSTISVSGSALNDGVYTVAGVTAGTLTLDPTDELVAEAAGANVNIVQSTFEKITPTPYQSGLFSALGLE